MRAEQIGFDPLDFEDQYGMDPAAARKEAQAARRVVAKAKEKEGYEVKIWTLTGQLRKYKEFGVPDGRVRSVYYLSTVKR